MTVTMESLNVRHLPWQLRDPEHKSSGVDSAKDDEAVGKFEVMMT